MGKKLLCLMLAALLGALCGCQGKAGDGSGLTSPSSVLLPPAESAPPAPPEESAQPEASTQPEADVPPVETPPIEEAPLPPPLPSGQSAPELLEGEPRLVLSLREYHPQKDGVGCGCIVEIPRLEGEGMEEANAPIDELTRRWENFLTEAGGHGNGYGPSMEVRTLPYTNARWIQAVVHYMTFPNYAYRGDACSVNFDRVEGRAVTVDEMLARMELTPELLTEGLKQQELSQVLFYFSYPSPRVQRVEVQAFRGREDGSAVFYLWLEVLPMEGLDEDHRLVMYDTRTGTFAEFRGRVPDSYLEPPNLSDPPLQWEKDPGFRAYS